MHCDSIQQLLLNKNYEAIDSFLDDWIGSEAIFPITDAMFCYTNGLLKKGRAGAGIFAVFPLYESVSRSHNFVQFI